ncbi:MAG: LecA/PA-IL family lectin [Acidobacteriota bacterium]|nr:hypothetical protein [Blastocatellia bacterium]MDW8411818.1 LecA/PA-IL family lectin [Acidobacteriota bacterium]
MRRALLLVAILCSAATADTIKLKNGEVVSGRVVNYSAGAFTVEIKLGSYSGPIKARIDVRDVESIEFSSTESRSTSSSEVRSSDLRSSDTRQTASTSRSSEERSSEGAARGAQSLPPAASSSSQTSPRSEAGVAKEVSVNVPAREEWTYANVTVKRGDKISLSATGKVKLSAGRESGPEGIPSLEDKDKLLASSPTGALIAVIGDDNDDFIFVGKEKEFVASRDGKLFLSVNEGNISDNEGAFSVRVKVEPKK